MMPVLWPEDAVYYRFDGYTKDADGFSTGANSIAAGYPQTIEDFGSFQPVSHRQIPEDLIDEGIEFEVYTEKVQLRPVDVENDIPADEIEWGGHRWRVVRGQRWTQGLAHDRFFLTRVVD